jgi:hypothetical protein
MVAIREGVGGKLSDLFDQCNGISYDCDRLGFEQETYIFKA